MAQVSTGNMPRGNKITCEIYFPYENCACNHKNAYFSIKWTIGPSGTVGPTWTMVIGPGLFIYGLEYEARNEKKWAGLDSAFRVD